VYHTIEARIRNALRDLIRERYALEVRVSTERPPRLEMGEVASPVSFDLAKRLKRAPRQIAEELARGLGAIEGVARWEVAGGGYLNAYLDRAQFFRAVRARAGKEDVPAPLDAAKIVVEHTNINPNKAAHIGHLRNAALGDAFVRLLRHTGHRIEVQNYIDNTGAQVADVVLGFLRLEKKSPGEVRALAAQPRFDYHCWDLYARVTEFLEADPARLAGRAEILQAIEEARGDAAESAQVVSNAIVRCHLRTMERLSVEYDLLPRESEILGLRFWEAAFEQLKARSAIQLETTGKNAGCWVMRLPAPSTPLRAGVAGLPETRGALEGDAESEAKIIVRSNGTVTYVGKDIAYQMWKFGLLGRDFHYARFHTHPSGHTVWVTCADAGEPGAPAFGGAAQVYNVIDSRQSYLQDVVVAGLRAQGFEQQAAQSVHFAYEIVALSPRCAEEMGYELLPEERKRPYVEVSGRRGLGVKADDLIDRLEASARAEVDARHPGASDAERARIAHTIALGALRYFLLKYTRSTLIVFDFHDALSFEGETGPYVQYAVVRARNIWRKLLEREEDFPAKIDAFASDAAVREFFASPDGNDFWELTLLAGSLGASVEAAVEAQEPAFVAKYSFELAQAFNLFYHKHHILSEKDPARKAFLLALTAMVEKQLVTALGLLGAEAPEKM